MLLIGQKKAPGVLIEERGVRLASLGQLLWGVMLSILSGLIFLVW
jgi:hypothetical protein